MTQVILYTSEDGKSQIQLRADGQTVWLTQLEMAELFSATKQNISLHLKNVFADGELSEDSVVKDSLTTAADGKRYPTRLYNLDAILAVGYRVRSRRGVQFRRWASTVLKEYLLKGFAMDDERLKNPDRRPDYFDEMLARIRDIPASEKRFYQKVRDLFALSNDYDKTDTATQQFFATVQNLLLYAVTQKTAAEIILVRANAADPHFGLLTWKSAQVRKQDIIVAKNYLTEDEIDTLDRLVVIFLETAELRAKRQTLTPMAFWQENVGQIIVANGFSAVERRRFGQPRPHGAKGGYAVCGPRQAPQGRRSPRCRRARRSRVEGAGKHPEKATKAMSDLSTFHADIKTILEQARSKARSAVNVAMVDAYWLIGQRIVQEEQQGQDKAQYGTRLLENLSIALTADFGKGFSYANLYNFRQFYRVFPDRQILYTLCRELSWSHLRLIIRADSQQAIEYYCKEAREQNWTVRQLERHIKTQSFQRLLSTQVQAPPASTKAAHLDFIKDPYVLEFLQLPEAGQIKESRLEQAIIDELQKFLLELGKGFSFVARQMRISTETSHFFYRSGLLQLPT